MLFCGANHLKSELVVNFIYILFVLWNFLRSFSGHTTYPELRDHYANTHLSYTISFQDGNCFLLFSLLCNGIPAHDETLIDADIQTLLVTPMDGFVACVWLLLQLFLPFPSFIQVGTKQQSTLLPT